MNNRNKSNVKNTIPELKNSINETMKHQYTVLTKLVRENFIKQETTRITLAREQFNQHIINVKKDLLTRLNSYIIQRENYTFLKFR